MMAFGAQTGQAAKSPQADFQPENLGTGWAPDGHRKEKRVGWEPFKLPEKRLFSDVTKQYNILESLIYFARTGVLKTS